MAGWQRGPIRSGTWFNNTVCNFNAAKGPIVNTNCFAQPGAENGGIPEFGNGPATSRTRCTSVRT